MRILVVEDEVRLATALCSLFTDVGHRADLVATAFAAVETGMSEAYDCIVLVVSLPDGTGYDVVNYLRETGCKTSVLILTDELIARVHALIRPSSAQPYTDELKYGRAVLHRESLTLTVGERFGWRYLAKNSCCWNARFVIPASYWRENSWRICGDLMRRSRRMPWTQTSTSFGRRRPKMGWRQVIQTVRGQGYRLGPPA